MKNSVKALCVVLEGADDNTQNILCKYTKYIV